MRRDECSDQERWVLDQVEKGEIADLKEKFGEGDENRCLLAKFLETLLTGQIMEENINVH